MNWQGHVGNSTCQPPRILPSNIGAFSHAIRKRLGDPRTEFAKRYLQVLVDEVVINGKEATIRGSYDKLVMAVQKTKEGDLDQVPSFMRPSESRPALCVF